MDYNSQRKKLILPEYGRNIQMMVDHLATITDRDERTRAAKTVISVMGNLYPHLRDVPDFRHKLWDHLMIMSNFTLDIDSPYPLPEKDILEEKPEKLPYNNHRIKYKHYGSSHRETNRENQRNRRPRNQKSTHGVNRQPHEKIIPYVE